MWLFALASPEHQAKFARLDQMPERAFRFRPHANLGYALNEHYASADGLQRHNVHGTRGAHFALPKPAGTLRIVCIGGSTTYETGVHDDRLTYPARLQEHLRERHGRPDVEVVNAGVPGYTSTETLILVALRVLEWQPDLVLHYDNTNDVHPRLVAPEHFASDNAGYRRPWDDDVRWWDRSLALRWLGVQTGFSPRNALVPRTTRAENVSVNPDVALELNDARWFRRNLEALAALCRARGVPLALASWAWCPAKGDLASQPHMQRAYEQHNALLAEVAREQQLLWLDLRPRLPTDPELWYDGMHVNERGAELKAAAFAELLAPFVQAR